MLVHMGIAQCGSSHDDRTGLTVNAMKLCRLGWEVLAATDVSHETPVAFWALHQARGAIFP